MFGKFQTSRKVTAVIDPLFMSITVICKLLLEGLYTEIYTVREQEKYFSDWSYYHNV